MATVLTEKQKASPLYKYYEIDIAPVPQEKVDAVMRNQMKDEDAMHLCDFVIVNNTTLEDVKRQLEEHFGASVGEI